MMEKVYGASERRDGLQQTGRRRWELYYGYGEDSGGSYNYLERLEHKPSAEEIRQKIIDRINQTTDEKILTGFSWNDMPVYLSSENQFNYKSVFDLAAQDASVLPVKFKMGEDADGNVVYHTFEDFAELKDFYTRAIAHINACLNAGWTEKDALDMSPYQ